MEESTNRFLFIRHMAKQTKYASSKGGNDTDDLSERLANDLRHHIRTLGHYPMLSDNWCEMADVLGRVANVSDVVSFHL